MVMRPRETDMMPIRFPTEAANDPDGKLQGMPESTGEDDTLRTRPEGAPQRQDRGNEPRRDDLQHEKDKDGDKG
jgi:hypothetical protein